MSLSNYMENALIDLLFANAPFTPISPLYVGLSTTAIADDGSGITEPVGGAYARVAVGNRDFNSWPAAVGGIKSNGTLIAFPTATAAWGTIRDFFVADASSGGTVYVKGTLTVFTNIATNDQLQFPATTLQVTFD